LSIQVCELSEGITLQISGELDFLTARELSRAVQALELDGQRRVVLDLTGLMFCDAGGVSSLLKANRSVRRQGGQLLVRGVSGLPRRILAITEVDQILDLE